MSTVRRTDRDLRDAAAMAKAAAALARLPIRPWGAGYDDGTEIITVRHHDAGRQGVGGPAGAAPVEATGQEITGSPWYARMNVDTPCPPVPLDEIQSFVIARFIAACLSRPDLTAAAMALADLVMRGEVPPAPGVLTELHDSLTAMRRWTSDPRVRREATRLLDAVDWSSGSFMGGPRDRGRP